MDNHLCNLPCKWSGATDFRYQLFSVRFFRMPDRCGLDQDLYAFTAQKTSPSGESSGPTLRGGHQPNLDLVIWLDDHAQQSASTQAAKTIRNDQGRGDRYYRHRSTGMPTACNSTAQSKFATGECHSGFNERSTTTNSSDRRCESSPGSDQAPSR